MLVPAYAARTPTLATEVEPEPPPLWRVGSSGHAARRARRALSRTGRWGRDVLTLGLVIGLALGGALGFVVCAMFVVGASADERTARQ